MFISFFGHLYTFSGKLYAAICLQPTLNTVLTHFSSILARKRIKHWRISDNRHKKSPSPSQNGRERGFRTRFLSFFLLNRHLRDKPSAFGTQSTLNVTLGMRSQPIDSSKDQSKAPSEAFFANNSAFSLTQVPYAPKTALRLASVGSTTTSKPPSKRISAPSERERAEPMARTTNFRLFSANGIVECPGGFAPP